MVLIRIRGEFGRIGDRVLNSSYPTSFVPNITQIIGIVNTVLGRKIEGYSFSKARSLLKELEEKVKVKAIYVVKMPKIVDFNILRISHDKSKAQLTAPIEYQYLYDFEYIVELEFLDKELEKKFVANLKSRKIKFTPILGSSECLIDIEITNIIKDFKYIVKESESVEGEKVVLYGYGRNYIFSIERK